MANEFYSNNSYKDQTIEYLLHILFIKIKEQMDTKIFHHKPSKLYDDLIKLRSEIYINPRNNWSIPLMAEKLHISCGHLQKHLFHFLYVRGYWKRITYAKELLIESDLSVREIANLCGYENDVHFMRQFKNLTTLTPTEYSRLNNNLNKC